MLGFGGMNYGLQTMLAELESHQLRVELVPLNPNRRGWNEGGCKRVKSDENPRWYKSFCGRHLSSRGTRRGKPDTRIRRFDVLRLLRRLSSGLPTISKYADEIRRIAKQREAA